MNEPLRSKPDVLVVGAGPTGLTMAAGLAARGVGCRVLDETPARSERSRVLVVHARSLGLLQKMDIAEEADPLEREAVRHELRRCSKQVTFVRGGRRRIFETGAKLA